MLIIKTSFNLVGCTCVVKHTALTQRSAFKFQQVIYVQIYRPTPYGMKYYCNLRFKMLTHMTNIVLFVTFYNYSYVLRIYHSWTSLSLNDIPNEKQGFLNS